MGRPLGHLRATLDGEPLTLDLAGTLDNVSGTATTPTAGARGQASVRGRYEPDSYTLTLASEGPDSAVYRLTFDPSLSTFRGTYTRRNTGSRLEITDGS